MAFLFVVENNVAKPNIETLMITPFKEIWERDTSTNKSRALKEFTYIEFMTSKKRSNPYAGYVEDERPAKLKKDLDFANDWQPDIYMEMGMAKIVEFQKEASESYNYYIDSLVTAEKTRKFLKEIDLGEKNPRTGALLYKPKDVTSALADTEKVIQTLLALKEQVEQQLIEKTRTKGNKVTNPFEI